MTIMARFIDSFKVSSEKVIWLVRFIGETLFTEYNILLALFFKILLHNIIWRWKQFFKKISGCGMVDHNVADWQLKDFWWRIVSYLPPEALLVMALGSHTTLLNSGKRTREHEPGI